MVLVCDVRGLVWTTPMHYLPHTPYSVHRAPNMPRIGKNWVYTATSADGRYLVCPKRLPASRAVRSAEILANDHHEAFAIAIQTLRLVPR